ncbi:RNA binding protein [Echinococcus multilocularis]|uniref:RNA binding protein n=1 Tax=Echinococcus multilocularis TaxID=6211 RepID=A0A068Y585_ECHMU|nr:RNA binding protein [Echinococcus multilocularis]
MGRDDIKRETNSKSSRESSSRRHCEHSIETHGSETSSYQKPNYRALCVRKISLKFDIDTIQEHLHDAFSTFGDVDIRIFKSSERRLAIIYFRHSRDAHRAYRCKHRVYIHDRAFSVEIWDEKEPVMHGSGNREESSPHRPRSSPKHSSLRPSPFEDRSRSPLRTPSRHSHYSGRGSRPGSMESEPLNDPKATRTLFVGSLEPDITEAEVREAFERYGVVEQIDVKHPSSSHAYAFVRFANVDMAVVAKNKMSGNCVRSYHCKIGYGKPLISNVLYISGLDNWRDTEELECFLNQFGTLVKLDWEFRQNYATAVFQSTEVAEEVNQQLKALALRYPDRRLMVDFIEGDIQKDVLSAPRQSSLIPLPSTFPIVPELIPSLPFPNQFVAAAFDLMRAPTGNNESNASVFAHSSAEDVRLRRQPRPIDSTRQQRLAMGPLPRRLAPISRFGGRGASPIDSLLRPDMTDLSDPVLSSIITMSDLEAFLRPHLWFAHLYTKKSVFRFRCLHVVGDERLAKELPQSPAFSSFGGVLRFQMAHQARTEASWMADAVEHINGALGDPSSSSPPFSILLALPNQEENVEEEKDKDEGDDSKPNFVKRPLTCLVSYLRLKQRAGFLTPLPTGTANSGEEEGFHKYTLLLLTPSSFSLSLLKFAAPRLSSGLAFVDDFLVLLLLRN